jgi:preprotein translocase subunit YajC
MKRIAIVILAIVAGVGAWPLGAIAQTTTTTDVLVEGSYRLPRSHQYQVYDAANGTYVNVDAASVPSRLKANQLVYDRTAQVWVSHPSVGGLNPMYSAAASGQAQGNWQRIHGQVVNVNGPTLQLRSDDGRTLTVDASAVDANIRQALTPNEGVTVIGMPGAQPTQFTARYIQQDSSNPARGGAVVGQAPAASAPAATSGATQQWQDVHGRVVSVQGDTMTFRSDDGRTLTVDVKAVSPQIRQGLKPNESATIVGFPGSQANRFTAQYIQQDSSDPSRGGSVAGQQPAGGQWQRVHGTVGTVSGNTLSLKTDDGRTVSVDMRQVDPGIRGALSAGEGVTVIGFYRGADRKTLDARFIQQDAGAAASPRTTK